MKEIKFKERIEKAYQAFFDETETSENSTLEFIPHNTLYPDENNTSFSEKKRAVLSILRQLLLFLPGAFVLFFASVALTGRFILVKGAGVSRVSLIQLILLLVLALMTVAGLGDLRNPKHFSIPLSIISIGVILGIVGTIFFDWFEFGYFIRNYVPYFFPLAFITPVLAKNWVDKLENKPNRFE